MNLEAFNYFEITEAGEYRLHKSWSEHKINTGITNDLEVVPAQNYNSEWLRSVDKITQDRPPEILKNYKEEKEIKDEVIVNQEGNEGEDELWHDLSPGIVHPEKNFFGLNRV